MKKTLLVIFTIFTLTLKAPPRPCTPLSILRKFKGSTLHFVSDYDTHITLTYTDPNVVNMRFEAQKDQDQNTWTLKRNDNALLELLLLKDVINIYSYLSEKQELIGHIPVHDKRFEKVQPIYEKLDNSTFTLTLDARIEN